ncbi:MAG: alanine racemase [Actinomycetia bacterium]|nr:alanine racemase [Actinomycetota bacterium]MCG2791481.1 alanine racemase [Actinomycetes bacterium]
MNYPCLKIDLEKISHNSRIINGWCANLGISVVGVTKCVLGDIKIAAAMKKSGVNIFGDSRLENLRKLRNFYGKGQQLMMLRSPMSSEASELVEICDISLNTQLEVVRVIAEICQEKKIKHRIIVMVETDDQREGLLPVDVVDFCRQVVDNYRSIELYGLGTNARCVTQNGPSPESLSVLKDLWEEVMKVTGRSMPIISGGNSSVWNLIEKGTIPGGINQVRIGEAILLGHDTVNYKPIKGAFADSFLLEAEIIEVKRKDGKVYKVILALGLQDVDSKNIYCCSPGLYIIGQSSDHTILGIEEDKFKKSMDGYLNLEAGGIISFNLDYFGLLSCMTSPFIKKSYIEG